ncbi:tRNA pseudouridine(55) synthase TruB [Methylohalobius crimeensis]|uniref:tRNA pseudouridine(55) synthase TruB n=1 Tax=Methylohalobius crimeensis TaxID=244365 RepID=UPI0003B763A8|nr:tRNA pseudouridine(55) synthase TruB [Methylohalobius crimeensis]
MSKQPRRRRGDDIHGILLLDKPQGVTSNHALQKVKRLLGARKAGHTGSLDPVASGLLPICLGEATKISPFLLGSDKRYRVTVRLGAATATGDVEGEITDRRPVPALNEPTIEPALARFRGEIDQIPPMYSALKQGGKRLYDLARQGIEVERPPRRVAIHSLELLEFGSDFLKLEIFCSKGTFIRTLAEDIGKELGTAGHVEALRRTRVGDFVIDDAVTLDRLTAMSLEERRRLLLPIDRAVLAFPSVSLSDDMAFYVMRGQPVMIPKLKAQGCVRLYNREGTFLGVGEVLDDGRVAPRRLFKLVFSRPNRNATEQTA